MPTLVGRQRMWPRPLICTQGCGPLSVQFIHLYFSERLHLNRHLLFWRQHPFLFFENHILVLLWGNDLHLIPWPSRKTELYQCYRKAGPPATLATGMVDWCLQDPWEPIGYNKASAKTSGTKMATFNNCRWERGWHPVIVNVDWHLHWTEKCLRG
jgi:hypothetical protein